MKPLLRNASLNVSVALIETTRPKATLIPVRTEDLQDVDGILREPGTHQISRLNRRSTAGARPRSLEILMNTSPAECTLTPSAVKNGVSEHLKAYGAAQVVHLVSIRFDELMLVERLHPLKILTQIGKQ